MKTSQSIQLLDTNDTNISPIVGVESIFYEQAENNKRKTLSDKLLLSGKDGSLSINTVSYDDASDKNIIVNLSTSKLDGADGSLFKLDVTQVSMTDFMGVIEEMIEEGGGGGGELGPVNASIRDISNRLSNVSDYVDTIGQSVDELDDEYNELNTSFGILDTSVGKLWDSSMPSGDVSINDIKIQDLLTPSRSIVNQTTKTADISIKTINSQSLIGLGNITISGGGDASIYDVYVNNRSVVSSTDKIAHINRSDFITDASIDAWNNGGLDPGTSQLGTINNTPFIYGQNITVSSDEAQDIKYSEAVPISYFNQITGGDYIDLNKNSILCYQSAESPVATKEVYFPINASGNVWDTLNGMNSSCYVDITRPILISGTDSSIFGNNPVYNDAYLYKNNIDLSVGYNFIKSGFNFGNRYCLYPQYEGVYLRGELYKDYSNVIHPNVIRLDSNCLIIGDGNGTVFNTLRKNTIDKTDTNKKYKYILIGYSNAGTSWAGHESGGRSRDGISTINFRGGVPKVYQWNSETQSLEEYIPYDSESSPIDPTDINSSITEVSTRLDNVSTRLDTSITNINSSVFDISTKLNGVDGIIPTLDIIDASVQDLWNSSISNNIPSELKAKHVYFGDEYGGNVGLANLPVACTSPTVITSQQRGYSQFWMSGANKFYLHYPIYCLGPNNAFNKFTDDVYIYKNNVNFNNSNISDVTAVITSSEIGKELYIMGHADGSIFYFDADAGGSLTQQTLFTVYPANSNYQYIPIGHVVDVSGGMPVINFVGGYVNNRIFDYSYKKGLTPAKTKNKIQTITDSPLDSSYSTRDLFDLSTNLNVRISSENVCMDIHNNGSTPINPYYFDIGPQTFAHLDKWNNKENFVINIYGKYTSSSQAILNFANFASKKASDTGYFKQPSISTITFYANSGGSNVISQDFHIILKANYYPIDSLYHYQIVDASVYGSYDYNKA